MTGYTVHTGSNDKFSKGWDGIFSKGPKKAVKKAAAAEKPPAAKKKARKK